jgi:hypothetical protein
MLRSYQGHSPVIPASCYIDASAQILGDVVLGERSSVWMNAVLRGDVNFHPRRLQLQRPGLFRPPRPAQPLSRHRGRLGHHRPQRHRPRLRGRGYVRHRHGSHYPERQPHRRGLHHRRRLRGSRAHRRSARARSGPAFPPSCAARSPTKIANSSANMLRTTSTMSKSTSTILRKRSDGCRPVQRANDRRENERIDLFAHLIEGMCQFR